LIIPEITAMIEDIRITSFDNL